VVPFLPKSLTQVLFDVFDQRKTGTLSKEEFLIGTTLVSHGTTNEKLRLLFSMYDRSQRGKLSGSDLRPFLNIFAQSDPVMSRKVMAYFNV